MSYKHYTLALILIGSFFFFGCGKPESSAHTSDNTDATPAATASSREAVDVVRNGVLGGYESTTVGKAFEGTFQDAKWTSFETAKGVTIVQFDGTILESTINKAGFDPYAGYKVPDQKLSRLAVRFQFTLSLDKKNFKFSYFNDRIFCFSSYDYRTMKIRSPATADQVMSFIYG